MPGKLNELYQDSIIIIASPSERTIFHIDCIFCNKRFGLNKTNMNIFKYVMYTLK